MESAEAKEARAAATCGVPHSGWPQVAAGGGCWAWQVRAGSRIRERQASVGFSMVFHICCDLGAFTAFPFLLLRSFLPFTP